MTTDDWQEAVPPGSPIVEPTLMAEAVLQILDQEGDGGIFPRCPTGASPGCRARVGTPGVSCVVTPDLARCFIRRRRDLETIVVGVDGSEPSLHALRTAANLAAHIDDVELIAVFARYTYVALPEHAAEDMYVDFLDRAEQEIRRPRRTDAGRSPVELEDHRPGR